MRVRGRYREGNKSVSDNGNMVLAVKENLTIGGAFGRSQPLVINIERE
ncbi:MAG: hypothetical protein J6P05_06135 [Lachnospiraceae bacterium]|nr:hypothetical protein [Lachnospiraceae bacterium]